MDTQRGVIAKKCLEGAESDSMTFPQVVSTLMQAGFEGYSVDLRRELVAYYLPSGQTVDIVGAKPALPVAADFDATAVKKAIREAQTLDCAGYMVSFLGRRVLYFARNAETHVEHFPQTK